MNTKSLIASAAFALVATTGAFAQEATSDAWMQSVQPSATTRAQVKADLAKARADGRLSIASEYNVLDRPVVAGAKTREQVRAELAQARASGQLDVAAEYRVFDQPIVSNRTRAEVKAEVLEAIARGEHLSQGDRS